MKLDGPYSSGAIIKCGKEMLVYLRSDDAPNNANKLAIFGGKSIDGETPKQTLIREIGEEIKFKNRQGLMVNEKQIHYLGLLDAGVQRDHDKHVFLVEIPEDLCEDLVIGNEGRKIVFL